MPEKKERLKQFLDNWEGWVSAAFLSLLILGVGVNVFMRFFLNKTTPWLEEIVTLFFIWSMFIGAAGCYRKRMHVGIDAIVNLLPLRVRQYVELFTYALMVVFVGYLAYLSYVFSISAYVRITPIMKIPYTYVDIGSAICFSLITIYAVMDFVNKCKEILRGAAGGQKEGETL